jgi:hypothetical protein
MEVKVEGSTEVRRKVWCWLVVMLVGWPVGMSVASVVAPDSEAKDWGEAWIEGRTYGWERLSRENKRFRQARQLLQSLNAQAEYDVRGRLLAKTHPDGSRETWRYDPNGSNATVWEAGSDGQLLEERYYWRNLLQARLQQDGTLQIYHHLAPLKLSDDSAAPESQSDAPALYVSVTDRLQTKILVFNDQGRLLGGFHPDGTPWVTQSPGSSEDLEQIAPREMLVLPVDEP